MVGHLQAVALHGLVFGVKGAGQGQRPLGQQRAKPLPLRLRALEHLAYQHPQWLSALHALWEQAP
ncbi:MAG TPA: hypothetical protein EYP54_11530, partial [Anaerolineales bacterium]|nr:hypothetical protein [Anaerolineales bacterium]